MFRLRELRKSKGWSMKQLGEMLNIAESTVSLYETGKREPDIAMLQDLANIFCVSVDELLGNTPHINSEQQEINEYLEELRTRPEMKMLFSLTKNATREDVEKAVKIIETMLGK